MQKVEKQEKHQAKLDFGNKKIWVMENTTKVPNEKKKKMYKLSNFCFFFFRCGHRLLRIYI